MRTRFTWIVAILALVSIGVVVACSTKYDSSYNGLVVVPSQGGGPLVNNQQSGPVMETFSLDLANGHVYEINNVNGPPTPGLPTGVVLDPAGANAYVIVTQNPAVPGGGVTGIAAFPIASDGKLGSAAMFSLKGEEIYVNGTSSPAVAVPVVPVAMTMDAGGKFLFVADSATADSSGIPVPGAVSVFSISNGSLTEVAGSPFVLPVNGANPVDPAPCTNTVACSSPSGLALTSTVYPPLYAYCSLVTPPTNEDLYVTDSASYLLLNYKVDPSAGTLSLVLAGGTTVGVPTGTVPSGVAVDTCNRFAYVSNASPNNTVSAFRICSSVNTVEQPSCPTVDYSLHPITGSPYNVGDDPGPLAVDAYGNFLYVVDTGSSQISAFKISPATGSLAPLSPATVNTGLGPNSIAIRNDDSWVFVANIGGQGVGSQTLSEYAITPATGELTPQAPISTFNYPSGVAVTQSTNR